MENTTSKTQVPTIDTHELYLKIREIMFDSCYSYFGYITDEVKNDHDLFKQWIIKQPHIWIRMLAIEKHAVLHDYPFSRPFYNDKKNPKAIDFLGFHTLKNGFTFFGIKNQGNHERHCAVCLIVYWDGQKLRTYVPTNGNPFNTETNNIYKTGDQRDFLNAIQRFPHVFIDNAAYNEAINTLKNMFVDNEKEEQAIQIITDFAQKYLPIKIRSESELTTENLFYDYAAMLQEIEENFCTQ